MRVFAVANETPVRQRQMRRSKSIFVVRVDLLLHVEVEAVGVASAALYRLRPAPRRTRRHPKELLQGLVWGFTWRAVQTKAVARILVFPLIHGLAQTSTIAMPLARSCFRCRPRVLAAEQRVNGFMDTNVAQRWTHDHFKDFRHVVVAFSRTPPGRIGATRAFHAFKGGRYGSSAPSAPAPNVHPAVSRCGFVLLLPARCAAG